MLRKARACDRMPEIRHKLEQWTKHEGAVEHSGMGNDELRRLDDDVVVQQQVYVNGPWGVAEGLPPTESRLDPLHRREERLRRQVRGDGCHQIPEVRLLVIPRRLGPVHSRNRIDPRNI